MDSKFKVIDLNSPQVSSRKRPVPIDWSRCCLCQQFNDDELRDPSKSKKPKLAGFDTLDRNLKEFQRLGKFPFNINIDVLSEGPGIKENLKHNNAKWHKRCFLQCSDSHLARLKKDNSENVPPSTSSSTVPIPNMLTSSVPTLAKPATTCLICDKPGTRNTPLQQVLPDGEKALKEIATLKEDREVLVKLQSCQTVTGVLCHKNCRAGYMYVKNKPGKSHFDLNRDATVMQHGAPGTRRTISTDVGQQKVAELPNDYAVVPASFLDPKVAVCPLSEICHLDAQDEGDLYTQEMQWLEDCRDSVKLNTWPGFHSRNVDKGLYKTRFAILPIFRNKSNTLDMMQHSMRIVKDATGLLNPTQVPVIVCDQPLYALCKQVQWLEPEKFGEDKMVVFMGAMHIEAAAMRVIGEWLEGSGWTDALAKSNVTTAGRADAALSVSHLTRSRYVHQVTAAVLHSLKKKAFDEYSGDDPLSFSEWNELKRSLPQFRFWDIALKLELIVLQLVRSLRLGDFSMFNEAISRIVPYFFALDHQNYARWLPVHIRDNLNLQTVHPSLYDKFREGYFVADKCCNKFSKIALDQAHEQLNAILKGSGGMVGLTEDPGALLKWTLSAPEVAKITTTFEETFLHTEENVDYLHHFDTDSARSMFLQDKVALEEYFINAGNPFLEETEDLYNLETRRCSTKEVVQTVMSIEELGAQQYHKFVEERLRIGSSIHIREPIPQNLLATFSYSPQRKVPKDPKMQLMKSDANLFRHMFLAVSNNRPADLDEFFAHENHEYPPALFFPNGNIRSTSKEDLTNKCLLPLLTSAPVSAPQVDVKVLDGAAVMHFLKPGLSIYFADYIRDVFLPFIRREAEPVSRLDIVWDVYRENSLKGETRGKRGDGPRVRVALDTRIPKNWPEFLRNDVNKTELFGLLADSITDISGKLCISTKGSRAICNQDQLNLSFLEPCNHEEADTRVFIHVADAARAQFTKFMIRASDTDIVVLACSCFPQIPQLQEMWIHLSCSKQRNYIPIHEICESLGSAKCLTLPALHAFSGCDNVEAFYGLGKVKAFNALSLHPEVIPSLEKLSEGDVDGALEGLGNLIISMYSPARSYSSINECRRSMCASSSRPPESIPPTEDAFRLHVIRSSYQAQVWRQLLQPVQALPAPDLWGWTAVPGGWNPVWRLLATVAKTTKALVRCKCKVMCGKGNCGCKHEKCTELCKCKCNGF